MKICRPPVRWEFSPAGFSMGVGNRAADIFGGSLKFILTPLMTKTNDMIG
jgi:hypothetical protein